MFKTEISAVSRWFALLSLGIVLAGCEIEGEALEDEVGSGSQNPPGAGTPLAITAPSDMSAEATGPVTAVNAGQPQASGGDGNYTINSDLPAAGLALGTSVVTWTVTDGAGSEANDTQSISVLDTTAPQLSAPGAIQMQASGNLTTVTLTPPTVSDLVDASPGLINDAPAGGFPMGVTNVTWTATDASSNSATAIQMVTITPAGGGPLTLVAPNDINAEASAPATPVTLGNAAASGGTGQLSISNNAPAGGFPVGATNVTWTVTDANNAMATDTQMVVIADTTVPTITAPADVTANESGTLTMVTLGTPVVADLADAAPTISNNAPVAGFPVGTTSVTWTAMDQSGNQASANQQVTINAVVAVACSTLEAEFASTIYPLIDNNDTCSSCHTPPNVVSTANGFNLLANDTAGFDLFRAIAKIKIGNESSMLVKALGGSGHGGGNRFAGLGDQDPTYVMLADYVNVLVECEEAPPTAAAAIEYGTDYEQAYRLTMALAARVPTTSEVDALASSDQAERNPKLQVLADQLMQEENFYVRLQEIYNDLLLTDKNKDSGGSVDNQFDLDGFSQKEYFESYSGGERTRLRQAANYGLARAPMELIRYVVENDRPFTEILTADYMMVNPYSATVLGVDAGDPNFPFSSDAIEANHDRDDFRPVMALQQDAGVGLPVPMAGVVATHAWLDKYLSTNTNVNRHRARFLFNDFLGVDIEGLAPRDGLDLDNVIGDVPTYEDPQCTVCHDVMDPIAGLFKNRSNNGEYRGDVRWQNEFNVNGVPRMLPPGYTIDSADTLPAGNEIDSLAWLMSRVAADDRFAAQSVRTVFEGLTRNTSSDPLITSFLNDTKNDFVAGDFDLKALIRDIVSSDFFLARNLDVSADPASFASVGVGRLLTPEELDRKISAVIADGYQWRGPNTNSTLRDRYNLPYGGIDSSAVDVRTNSPNTLIDGVQERIANQVACDRVAMELNGGNGQLFPFVDVSSVPAANEAEIRDNIAHLYALLLGEEIAADSAETAASYQLFLDVRATGVTAIASDCRGGGGASDDNGTVIPWMAVVAYLLSDFGFVYE